MLGIGSATASLELSELTLDCLLMFAKLYIELAAHFRS